MLAPLSTDDLSNEAFPFLTARAITVGRVPVYALRVTYVGELGWELYAHAEFGGALWDTLWEAGRDARPRRRRLPGDRRAPPREGLPRLVDATSRPTRTPYEAGLGFAVRLDKETEFIGRDALVAAKAAGPGSGCAASSSTTRGRSASATSRSASAARSSAG